MSTRSIKVGPAAILVAILAAVVIACGAILLYKKLVPTAQADSEMPLAARIDQTDGDVGVDRQLDAPSGSETAQSTPSSTASPAPVSTANWGQVTRNSPVSVGDRIYCRDGSHAGVAFSGRRYARLDSGAFLDVLSLNPNRTQLALRDGTAMFEVGDLRSGELYEVGTPCGAVDFQQPGLYQISFGTDGNAIVTVLRGLAQVVGLAGSGRVARGEMLTLSAASGDQAFVSNLAPDYCGRMVDSYYRYRYPNEYDGRYSDYDKYIASPDYDPYDGSVSHRYITDDESIAGLDDLDEYGRWQDVSGYGQCWAPNEDEGWVPYRQGYWVNDGPVGLSWVSSEPWGWAPYHYGRWASVDGRWLWVPGREIEHPVYSPALVAFVSVKDSDNVAWVPLGPKDPYVPCYYDSSYRAHYIGSATGITVQKTVYNLEVPGAVTAVPVARFTGLITPSTVVALNARDVTGARPIYNPFELQPVRRVVAAEPVPAAVARVQVPPAVIQQTIARPVVTSVKPVLPAVVSPNTLARMAPIRQAQPNEAKRNLNLNKTGQTIAPVQAEQGQPVPGAPPAANGAEPGLPQNPQMQARMQNLQEKAARGNVQAEQKLQKLQQEQQAEQQQAQAKAERKAERQQTEANAAAQAQQQQQLKQQQRQQESQLQQQQLQQQQQRQQQQRQQQQQQQQQQLKQQRKEERQQQNQQQASLKQQEAAAQQARIAARQQAEASAAAERAQQKAAERRAEAQAAAQRAQERESRKQNAQQQSGGQAQPQRPQPQAQSQSQPQSQAKAERKAERKAQRNGH